MVVGEQRIVSEMIAGSKPLDTDGAAVVGGERHLEVARVDDVKLIGRVEGRGGSWKE